MSLSRYNIVDGRQFFELEIKKSRFLGHAEHTVNRAEAMTFVAKVKSEHPQANHNCWAFQAGPPGSSRDIGCSDDGEPHGTAGKPILNVLMHTELGETTIVITRYFGGVKLGTGGLVRAYSGTAKALLDNSLQKEKHNYRSIVLGIEYNHWPLVEVLLKQNEAVDIQPKFEESIEVCVRLDENKLQNFKKKYQDITQGKGTFRKNE